MTTKELRRLSRIELLEMLLQQEKENELLQARNDELEKQLRDRTIRLNRAGSIAEAAFLINGIFETAEATCSQYLENIRRLSESQDAVNAQRDSESKAQAQALLADAIARCQQMEAESREKCSAMEAESRKQCEAREADSSEACQAREAETAARCSTMTAEAERAVNEKWAQISRRLNDLYSSHEGLLELVNFGLTLVPKRGDADANSSGPETRD